MFLILWIVVLAVGAILFYCCGPHSRFKKYDVKYPTPVPLLGDMARVVFRRQHWFDDMDRIYKQFPKERFIGITEFIQPVIVIRDPDLVKRVTVQDFEHFCDHKIFIDRNVDEIFGRIIFTLKGQEWTDIRSKLTPLFTGSKLRLMMPFMEEAGENMITRVKTAIQKSGKSYLDLDIKDVTFRFSNDVYAASAYGFKLDSQNAPTKFYDMAKLTVQLGLKELLKYSGYQVIPTLMQKLNIRLLPDRPMKFFKNLLMKTSMNRQMQENNRPDMIDLLLRLRKDHINHEMDKESKISNGDVTKNDVEKSTTKREWSDMDLFAQIIGFLLGSIEVVASSMAFLVHVLALHPDIQEKLVMEINGFAKKDGGKLDFDSIQQMTYLDMVVSELLRMWATTFMERVCTKDYNLGRPNDRATKDYIVRKGETIRIWMRSLAYDPVYFPHPHKFDPERFSEENRSRIRSGTHNPFGMGPRICIGYRFALTELKVMICTLLHHMTIAPCAKTSTVLQLSKDSINLVAKGGHWVRLQLRTQK